VHRRRNSRPKEGKELKVDFFSLPPNIKTQPESRKGREANKRKKKFVPTQKYDEKRKVILIGNTHILRYS